MPLFLITHRVNGVERVYIKEANTELYARLAGAMDGILDPADYVRSGEIDPKQARKVPKKMQGRLLTQREAQALLKRLG